MNGTDTAINIHFAPHLPESWLIAIAVCGAVTLALAAWKSRNGLALRFITFMAFMMALLNPSLLEEQREPVRDVAVIIADRSPSQNMDGRKDRTDRTLRYIQNELADKDDLDVRIVEAPPGETLSKDTRLFSALEQALADVPLKRRAGVVFLTDGQVHDIPQNPELHENYGPVHILLSGKKNEKDRQLVVTQAPAYGIVGQSVTMKYKIEDTDNIGQPDATVTVNRHDGPPDVFVVPVNKELPLELPVNHAGQNVFEISVSTVNGEITESNNRSALIVNGVRDRLRVLLVSGKPHAGGRTWRDLLTSDPGVDLIHFTILREPNKLDSTPQKELSLIAFPFRELFEIKLYDFDLIIFDRYRLNRILPNSYFNNIVRYVEEGGALLEASGPSFASDDSIYFTALMNVLPGTPTGEVIKQPFLPSLTQDGKHHPVTRNLFHEAGAASDTPWGPWLRQVVLTQEDGDILMDGANNKPLLILDRVKEGRVAQIASDHIWLWSRGYEGGGPHSELLRRVVHWLMKEPELDEKALDVKINDNTITVRSQNYKQSEMNVTSPDGSTETLTLETTAGGGLEQTIIADQLGIYAFEDAEGQKRFAVIGDLNPPELRGVKTTAEFLAPLITASQGGILWLNENPQPTIRYISRSGNFAGRNWIGFRKNHDYTVSGVIDRPLLPEWLAALILLTLATVTWWREGRRS